MHSYMLGAVNVANSCIIWMVSNYAFRETDSLLIDTPCLCVITIAFVYLKRFQSLVMLLLSYRDDLLSPNISRYFCRFN